jgi:integrase
VAINKRGDKYVVDWWTDGKRYRKFFDRQHDARDFAARVRDEKRLGTHVAADRIPLFRDAAHDWLTTRSDRAESSYDQYAGRINRHLIPRFGDVRIDQISPEAITTWRAQLVQTGATSQWRKPMSPHTVSVLVNTLSSIFESAVRNGRLSSNPVKKLERAYSRAREGKREDSAVRPDEILNPDEIKRMLMATAPGLFKTLITLAAATGARSGELLAVKWSNIAFDDKPQIAIRRSLSWSKGPNGEKSEPRLGPCKTDAGPRDIPIGPSVAHALKLWKMAAGPNELDLVFAAPDGKPMRRSMLLRSGFWPALKRAGLRRVRFHSLRHSFASGLIARGAPVTEVQHLLGHSDPAVTLKVYSHWFQGADSGAAGAYSAALFGTDTN